MAGPERDFQRLAIVNRGEAAMRLIHAVRDWNREAAGDQGRRPLTTIALYTEPDRRALFVREADEAIDLGAFAAPDGDGGPGARPKLAYLDYRCLEAALVACRAEAAWVGWGFVAEHAEFADLCDRLGIVFVGPDGDVMRRLADKIAAKRLAEKAGVPVLPWSGGPVDSVAEVRSHAERLGYPLLIKASGGGGGRGIRRVLAEGDLEEALSRARSEAARSFGDPTVFVERMVPAARHVEVQILGDTAGTIWGVGVRDCTLQRRHQKVLEEAPSPALTAKEDRALRKAAVRLGRAVGYTNAGTVEFLFDPANRQFWFLEVNARLQVEHPVTEATTGLDLVKLQLHVARGGLLKGRPPATRGHAIEVRLNAEDPDGAFAPAPGRVELLRLPTGPGVRIDTGVEEGDEVPPDFDSMIAKLIAWGRDRDEALARLRRALGATAVVIRGGASNKGFLQEILDRPELASGAIDVGWLDLLVAEGAHRSRRGAEVAILAAAIEAYEDESAIEKARFYDAAARGRPEVAEVVGRALELRYWGETYPARVDRLGPSRFRVAVDGRRIEVAVERLGRFARRLSCCGRRFRVFAVGQGLDYRVEVEGVPHRVSRDAGGVVRAPAPAVVVSLAVAEGDEVEVGRRLAVVEAMKMETSIFAPFAGRVRKLLVRANVQVATGDPLLVLEPTEAAAGAPARERLHFDHLEAPAADEDAAGRWRRHLVDLKRLIFGYDASPPPLHFHADELGSHRRGAPADDDAIRRAEDGILETFVDLLALFRRQPEAEEAEELDRRSSEEHLFTYLRDLDARGEGLPAAFLARLRRALSYYRVDGLARSPELEECLFRIAKSHQRLAAQIPPVLAVLERRLAAVGDGAAGPAGGGGDGAFRAVLDRLIAETQGREPSVHDLARELRYRLYDRPLLDAAQRRAWAAAEADLDALNRRKPAADRSERIGSLVDCPQPLLALLSRRFGRGRAELRRAMLEVMIRRPYRIRKLERVDTETVYRQHLAIAEYPHDGGKIRVTVVATHVRERRLERAVKAVAKRVLDLPAGRDVVVDLYVRRRGGGGERLEPDALCEKMRAVLNGDVFPPGLRRVVAVVIDASEPGAAGGDRRIRYFTFRPGPEGYREEKLYRGLHPMMAKRLQLWRLKHFAIQRLPSAEDIFFFHGVAHDNPRDERLFAVAEVRDVTPVTDEDGRVVQLPELERVFMEALAAIRRFQSRQPPDKRLLWNRVLLYVWPTIRLHPAEIKGLVQRLAPLAEGLGLEKVAVRSRIPDPRTGEERDWVLEISNPTDRGLSLRYRRPSEKPLGPLDEYARRVVALRRRGLVYPYEIVKMLTPPRSASSASAAGPELPPGDFVEYDLDGEGRLGPVERPWGGNRANVVVGLIRNFTAEHPEGMARVIVLGDASRNMGSLAEPECRRVVAALELAERLRVPLEWFAVSAGARISMDSGVENMDWIARVLRRLVEFTQGGGEVNLVVPGVNVGAQPYWNAEATMLMHTRGILIMTPDGAMVLTGKQALDYSGGVSAEDNQGIGGYERIMGPNGQAQYFAQDLNEACRILLTYYRHSYVAPGERFPRPTESLDPRDRDVRDYPHGGEFTTVGEVFSERHNPGRKKPFDIRRVMRAVSDQDHPPLERWFGMEDAEIAVVWDAHLGGHPLCLVGFESKPLARLGFVPAYGPSQWTSGTLFPLSSKKVARAINAASGSRPLVVLANLSGFDGSPESMRWWQLEYGAEIGRAVVNFKGPIVFCVVSRYHGGAFVVFSNALQDNMQVAALEGALASVIGGAPAAAVVFAREVDRRVDEDPRVAELVRQLADPERGDKARLRTRLEETREAVRSEKLGEVADEFDRIHSIHRAREVGSVHEIVAPARLRPYLIEAVERGMERELAGNLTSAAGS